MDRTCQESLISAPCRKTALGNLVLTGFTRMRMTKDSRINNSVDVQRMNGRHGEIRSDGYLVLEIRSFRTSDNGVPGAGFLSGIFPLKR